MSSTQWPVRTLPVSEDDLPKSISAFDCGNDDLNTYFKKTALFNQQTGNSRTKYCHPPDDPDTVAGYYSLALAVLDDAELPSRIRRKLPDHDTHAVPLIARLAVDHRYQQRGLGARLLIRALVDIVECSDRIGVPVIAVRPTDDSAVRFYKRYGFTEIADSTHMFLRLSTAMKLVSILKP